MIEDKTPVLGKKRSGFFVLGIGKPDRWQKARPDPEFSKRDDNNKGSSFELIIDALVFQLYFPDHMKEKEIDTMKFVEQDLKEVLGEDDFEQLPDEQKENIVEELHKRWSTPDSEIVKRMNSFAEKSPDILKPILESK